MKLVVSAFVFVTLLTGCQSVIEPDLTQAPISIESEQLEEYWIANEQSFEFDSSRLKHPNQAGYVKIQYLIDSSGQVSNAEVVASEPSGGWDQQAMVAVNHLSYTAAPQNTSKVPVYVTTTFEFNIKY